MGNYSADEKRLAELSNGNRTTWNAWIEEMRSPFRAFFLKRGYMDDDLLGELFQEATIAFYDNVRRGKLQSPLKSQLKTYLIGIGKVLARKKGKQIPLSFEIPEIPVAPDVSLSEEDKARKELVARLLNQMGEGCQEVLTLHFLKGYSLEAVAHHMSLPTVGAARKRKFDCLKRLKNLVFPD